MVSSAYHYSPMPKPKAKNDPSDQAAAEPTEPKGQCTSDGCNFLLTETFPCSATKRKTRCLEESWLVKRSICTIRNLPSQFGCRAQAMAKVPRRGSELGWPAPPSRAKRLEKSVRLVMTHLFGKVRFHSHTHG